MDRVDFYHLTRDPVETAVAALARHALKAGERVLVVAGDPARREAISRALWSEGGGAFLAHGDSAGPHCARQPILLSDGCDAPNEARFVMFADGIWRVEAERFVRAFLLFDDATRDAARQLWRDFQAREDIEFKAHRQDEQGRWKPL